VDPKSLTVYFVLGGATVALATYFGSTARGLLAAFVAFFPSITILTFSTIYFKGGASAATDYGRSMILLTPAWLAYVAVVLYLLPRLGLFPSLLIGVLVYVGGALTTARLFG